MHINSVHNSFRRFSRKVLILLRSYIQHLQMFLLRFLNPDKLVKKIGLRLVLSTCLPVFRNRVAVLHA
jgi:hypothetical protein